MAEAAGLVVGVVALAGLFNDAVDCFEFVQLGRNFGKDFQTNQIKLDNAQLRLSRWGKSLGLSENLQQVRSLADSLGSDNIQHAEESLGHILDLFADAEGMSNSYKSRKAAGDSSLITYDSRTDLEPAAHELHNKMRQLSLERQQRSGLRQKVKWALYEERNFKYLIENISSLVDGLVDLFPASEAAQRRLCDDELSRIGPTEGLPILREVAASQDRLLADALARVGSAGNTTYHTVFSGSNNRGTQMGHNSGTLNITYGRDG